MICNEPAGHATRLVCPYHQWTYGLDGRLLACRGMQADLDKSQFGLHQIQLHELEGLIYLNLSEDPHASADAQTVLAALLKPQVFRRPKIPKTINYSLK